MAYRARTATCGWDWKLIDRLNLPREIIQPISMSGESLGHVRLEIAERIGFKLEVVLVTSGIDCCSFAGDSDLSSVTLADRGGSQTTSRLLASLAS